MCLRLMRTTVNTVAVIGIAAAVLRNGRTTRTGNASYKWHINGYEFARKKHVEDCFCVDTATQECTQWGQMLSRWCGRCCIVNCIRCCLRQCAQRLLTPSDRKTRNLDKVQNLRFCRRLLRDNISIDRLARVWDLRSLRAKTAYVTVCSSDDIHELQSQGLFFAKLFALSLSSSLH